jgi:hypothetical protein
MPRERQNGKRRASGKNGKFIRTIAAPVPG